MTYLDYRRIAEIDSTTFQNQKPYPWVNPDGLLTEAGYRRLLDSLPDVSLFETRFGMRRAHGQQSHDRYVLEYHDSLNVPEPWKEFIAELLAKEYQGFLRRLLGVRSLEINFHWHYTPNGCSVSPHCDAKHKLGSHIFYFNTEGDWDSTWGGETVILDDGGRFRRKSAPQFKEFDQEIASQALGNFSLLFARKGRSWHGVREIRCPPDRLRKVFIIVINRLTAVDRFRRFMGKAPAGD